MKTTLDLALIRWSVAHRQWHELANDMPNLGAFLAGWFMRDMGAEMPEREKLGTFCDSFRKGWKECDDMIVILDRERAELEDSLP